jgi:alcohol dehydrogenase, propanol-preferring
MLLDAPKQALRFAEVPTPEPGPHQLLIRVAACGVCRTDLHIVDGELDDPKLPLIPGHEIVGQVIDRGTEATRFDVGARVGVPWLAWTDETCTFCRTGRENLCLAARFTGYHVNGGYADYTVADERYCVALPDEYADAHAAPLLCAGLIGFRALDAAGDAQRLGLYGFGASAHLIAQLAIAEGRRVFAFTRPGDDAAQAFARSLGVQWAGGSDTAPPERLDSAIIFAPVGALVPAALEVLERGGTVVCAGIHMSDIPSFSYDLLWEERTVRSIANLTRHDATTFLRIAPGVPVRTRVKTYPLPHANRALDDLRAGRLTGAAVLIPGRTPL